MTRDIKELPIIIIINQIIWRDDKPERTCCIASELIPEGIDVGISSVGTSGIATRYRNIMASAFWNYILHKGRSTAYRKSCLGSLANYSASRLSLQCYAEYNPENQPYKGSHHP